MRALCVRLGTIVLGVALASPAFALSLRDRLPDVARQVGIAGPPSAFDALAGALADTAARTLPTISGSAGFTYRYNAALEVFERTSDTLGPIFLERPDTLGRGKLNVNVSYQYVDLNEFDGTATKHLQSSDPIVLRIADANGNLQGFTGNRLKYDLGLTNHIEALSVTYGILDNLDVNVLVPLIETVFGVTATNQRVTDLNLNPLSPPPAAVSATSDATKVGVGDILLRGKYQLQQMGDLRSAVGLQLRLPSGSKDDFQGTGAFEASPFIYLSTLIGSRLEPHANLGVDFNSDDVSHSQARWGVGVDGDVTRRIGVALGFLGRDEFARSSPAGATSFQHLVNGARVQEPLLGIDFHRKDYCDLSFGARAVVWRQMMVFVNGIYALNKEGLRNDSVIPTIGFEGTF